MTSRERVFKAINHQEPDRVPMDFFGTDEVKEKLRTHFGLPPVRVPNNQTVRFVNPALLDRLQTDFRFVIPEYSGPSLKKFDDGSYIDIFSCRRVSVANQAGSYEEVLDPPLAHAMTVEDVDAHPWPDPEWFDFSTIKEQCDEFEDKAIVIGSWGTVDFINISSRLRGMEQVLLDIGMKNPVIFRIFDRLSEFFYQYMSRFYDICPEKYIIAFYGDDYGTQRGPTISPQTFREIFMPRWKRHFDLAHKHNLKVMLHSCGSTRMLMPDFIKAGIDILETVQPEAAGMNPQELKQEFGDKLCFHGMISVQQVLPYASPNEVKEVVRERISVMKKRGGYILAPTHNIQPDTPVENIIALYEAGLEYGKYN